ncbi:hypothetical protein BN2476_630104 [Paraburkholderia piptadeniae]|uniref:Uncharacterized protein n=2 Tax=Paraburkholderia TaxID=1822464 RepID=A0A7X1NB61_9BURK|nr:MULTISPECIES: hypothetical protein [Paraburkholderia]MPW18729.1 hypothetical protein [Paraburkholderia franconis]SIT48309.1 hypothetical protein BN2476_630104 [Paraburkholderia piptadeniae]
MRTPLRASVARYALAVLFIQAQLQKALDDVTEIFIKVMRKYSSCANVSINLLMGERNAARKRKHKLVIQMYRMKSVSTHCRDCANYAIG